MNPFKENSKERKIFEILPNEYKEMFEAKTLDELESEFFGTVLNLDKDVSAEITIDLLKMMGKSLLGEQPNLFDAKSSHTSILILLSTTLKLKEIHENNLNQKLT